MNSNPTTTAFYNPNPFSIGQVTSAGPFNYNIISNLTHVYERRLPLTNIGPVNTPGDGQTWAHGAVTASLYKTHGTVIEGDYDHVADNSILMYGGPLRDSSLHGTSLLYDYKVTWFQPGGITRNNVPATVQESWSPNANNSPYGFSTDFLVATSQPSVYTSRRFPGLRPTYYNSHVYTSICRDFTTLQLTTRDLCNPNMYLNNTGRSAYVNGWDETNMSTVANSGEGSAGVSQTSFKINIPTSTTSADFGIAYGYVGQLMAHKTQARTRD